MSCNAATDVEVFIYTGLVAPRNAARVRVDTSITSIPAQAFCQRDELTEVELCEGVVEIGERSFAYCNLTKINIPNSVRRICNSAFNSSLRCRIRLHDGIESIGEYAFDSCIFTNFRVPPLITTITNCMLRHCKSMFSLELPDNCREIGYCAFGYCYCLRNVAFPLVSLVDKV
jgi:hypothetical protein